MPDDTPEVDPRAGATLVEGGALLLDVREPDEWAAGHAAAAVHIPMREVGARLDELPRGRRIVAVCRSGARSMAVATALRAEGFDAVNLGGGMRSWESDGLPIVTLEGAPGLVI